MESVLISIQPYYVFLIIARLMGWDIPQEKTIEVRKDYPKDGEWNKITLIYCGKNRKSFNRIPKQYQPFMAKLLGKVIGEFMCDKVDRLYIPLSTSATPPDKETVEKATCLSLRALKEYANGEMFLYGWHISDLKIYDTPKRLDEFYKVGKHEACKYGKKTCLNLHITDFCKRCEFEISSPPQSWCYVEDLQRLGGQ